MDDIEAIAAAAFGGALPSGTAVIERGQATATVTVNVPASAFATHPTDRLRLSITPSDTLALFAPEAEATLINPTVLPGPPAGLAVSLLSDRGTLTLTGNDYTLDLGTLAQGTGSVTARLGIVNTGQSGSDELAGGFTASGPAAFTLTNFISFGPLAGQVTNTAPRLTFSTDTAGVFTETITIQARDVNNTGYDAPLPDRTLTVKGTVAPLIPPVITAPASFRVFQGMPSQVTPLSVSDSNAPGKPLTVTVTTPDGTLSTQVTGALGVTGDASGALTLTGLLPDINAALAALTFTGANPGDGAITLTVMDADRGSAARAIGVNTVFVPTTPAVFVAPVDNLVVLGKPSGLAGLKLVDPRSEVLGTKLTLTLNSPNSKLSVKGPPGAAVTGQDTGTLTITGTVAEINALLADDLIADFGTLAITTEVLAAYLLNQAKHQLAYFLLTANLKGEGGVDLPDPKPTAEGLISIAGPEAKGFLMGVTAATFALNSISAFATGGTPPLLADLERDLWVIMADAHVVSGAGTIYDFNPVGEFVLAGSKQPGDSFLVQGRLRPLADSPAGSMITQIAAQVGGGGLPVVFSAANRSANR